MGWLGWTWQEALATDVNAISLALEGREELLAMIFGSGKKDKPRRGGKMTADGFRKLVRSVNRRMGRGGKHG